MVYSIRQARRLAEKTQLEASKAIGVCEHTYRKLEKHPELVTVKQASELAKFFGMTVDEISFCEQL